MPIITQAIVQVCYGLQANLPSSAAGIASALSTSLGTSISAGSINPGIAFFCTDTGNLYVWNGSSMSQVNGSGGGGDSGFEPSITTQTANYTTATTDNTVRMNSTSATTVTLKTTGLATGWVYRVKNENTGAVTIAGQTGTIDGQSSVVLPLQYQAVDIQFDGTNFSIL